MYYLGVFLRLVTLNNVQYYLGVFLRLVNLNNVLPACILEAGDHGDTPAEGEGAVAVGRPDRSYQSHTYSKYTASTVFENIFYLEVGKIPKKTLLQSRLSEVAGCMTMMSITRFEIEYQLVFKKLSFFYLFCLLFSILKSVRNYEFLYPHDLNVFHEKNI